MKSLQKDASFKRLRLLRFLSQFTILAILIYIGVRHQLIGGGPDGAAPLDTYCVFGGVETLWNYMATGTFLSKTNFSNLILLGAALLLVLFTGSSFCGWFCPLGTIQEWLNRLGKKIFGRTIQLPSRLDRYLRFLRFVILGLILWMTFRTASLWFADYDPLKALFHFEFETTTSILIVAVFLILSVILERFWCKYLCPLGALFSLFAPLGLFKLKRTSTSCLSCSRCNRTCPMGLDVAHTDVMNDGQCIQCLDCVGSCPSEGTLHLSSRKKWSLSPLRFALAVLIIFWGSIGLSMLGNVWVTTTPDLPEDRVIAANQVETDIKGWMTFEDISMHTQIPLQDLFSIAGLPAETDPKITLKNAASEHNFVVDDYKAKLEERMSKKEE